MGQKRERGPISQIESWVVRRKVADDVKLKGSVVEVRGGLKELNNSREGILIRFDVSNVHLTRSVSEL